MVLIFCNEANVAHKSGISFEITVRVTSTTLMLLSLTKHFSMRYESQNLIMFMFYLMTGILIAGYEHKVVSGEYVPFVQSSKISNRIMHAYNGNMTTNPFQALAESEGFDELLSMFDDGDENNEWDDLLTDLDALDEEDKIQNLQDWTPKDEKFSAEPDKNEFVDADFIDILGPGFAKRGGHDFKFEPQTPVFCKLDDNHYQNYNHDYIPLLEQATVITKGDVVMLKSGSYYHQIGLCKSKVPISFALRVCDPFKLASEYNENVKGKGTCLGYSLFVHLSAIILLSQPGAIIEPIENHDLYQGGQFYEITGVNYDRRETTAGIIINKYELLRHYADTEEKANFLRYSLSEDQYDNSFFVKSAFDQEDSPYTDIVNKLHDITRRIDVRGMEQLYGQYRSYISRQPVLLSKEVSQPYNSSSLRKALLNGRKHDHYPSLFRVPHNAKMRENANISVPVYTGKETINSTFHTMTDYSMADFYFNERLSDEYEPGLCSTIEVSVNLLKCLLENRLFRTVYIESELMSKITGRVGTFYSPYSHVGISWKATKSNSNIYYVCYFCDHDPTSTELGMWQLEPETKFYRSPTFLASISDVNFAITLPFRFAAQISSVLAYTTNADRGYVNEKLYHLLAMCRWSSWQTSALAADTRFLFLCMISETGDIQSMLDKIAEKVVKPLKCCDAYFIHKLIQMIERKNKRSDLTPLLELPMKFISVEKDLPLMHMWHIRGNAHATDSYKKLCLGVVEEIKYRSLRIKAMEDQYAYLVQAMSIGRSQMAFDDLMNGMPKETPYYNHILFMALSWKSASLLNAGARQTPTKMSISEMITDHHITDVDHGEVCDEMNVKTGRVADIMQKVLNEYGNPSGIHQLVQRLAYGKKITNVYAIHPKDSKSKNREIPQMSGHMRAIQHMSEVLISVYTDAESTDMMQDSEKYSKFVERFSKIMRHGGLSRSEDKTFFCGHMHPEMMSLATYAVAKVLGSTSLVTSSAIQRTNKSRWTVAPSGCEVNIIPAGFKMVNFHEGKFMTHRPASLNYIHMQQGVYAMAAALINTVFTSGLDLMQKEIMKDIEDTCVMTTSDDSARAIQVSKKSNYDMHQIADEYINRGPDQVRHFMMIDSKDKPIRSNKLAEFNNVVTGPNGMYPQQFVHSYLIIQPLTAMNPMDDIIAVVSNARSSLAWGDSIDLARMAYAGNIELLCKKWLFTEDDIRVLINKGILPYNDESLIAGFHVNNRNLIRYLWSVVYEPLKEQVLEGKISIFQSLRRYNINQKTVSRFVKLNEYQNNLAIRRAFDRINSARMLKGRRNAMYLRPVQLTARLTAKNNLMNAINAEEVSIEPEIEKKLLTIVRKPNIFITPMRSRVRDFQPAKIGTMARVSEQYDISSIESYRLLGVYASNKLSAKDFDLTKLTEEEFERWYRFYKQYKGLEGLMTNSPSGRPLMRVWNQRVFKRPMTFDFTIDTVGKEKSLTGITVGGVYFSTFKPMWITNSVLIEASKNPNKKGKPTRGICFGHAKVGNDVHVFFSEKGGKVCKALAPSGCDLGTINYRGKEYVFLLGQSLAPLDPSVVKIKLQTNFAMNIVGDFVATLNYGCYINSNALGAQLMMKEIYNHFSSSFPLKSHRQKFNYPHFFKAAMTFDMGSCTEFIGNKSIMFVKLKKQEGMKPLVRIDCTQPKLPRYYQAPDLQEDEIIYE